MDKILTPNQAYTANHTHQCKSLQSYQNYKDTQESAIKAAQKNTLEILNRIKK